MKKIGGNPGSQEDPSITALENIRIYNVFLVRELIAVMFSLIETAKENRLDPYRYLAYVLTTAPNLN